MIEAEDGPGDADRLAATPLGSQVSRQYVTPETGVRIVDGLERTAEMDGVTGLTILEVICNTPDMQDTYLGNRERADMYQFATRHAAEFTTEMGEAEEFERWLESVKTARILHEWTEDADVETLVDRYRIGPGDLESRVERAEWLLGAADALAELLDLDRPEIGRLRAQL
jgi:helicase